MSESFSCSISVAYSSLGVTKVDHMCLEMGGLIPFLPCKPAPNKLYNVRLSALLYQIFNVNIASSISCYTEMDGTVCFFDRLITNLPTVNFYIWCVDSKCITLRDRPFNLKGGLWFFVSFINCFRTTQELEYFFSRIQH
jgi:hypothetical protein